MSSQLLSILLLASLLSLAVAHRGPKPKDKIRVMVEGIVYCQSCSQSGWSLTGAKGLPSAKVSITCRDHKNRPANYNVGTTDGNGYFLATVDVTDIKDFYKHDPEQACSVRLLASPDVNCNLFTNINNGLSGASIRDEGKRVYGPAYDTLLYATGPLAFRPAYCVPSHW
ncbi:non-classical arabinogalactan protein 30-like [Typha angustifolia]|uniref:non-classical arabinogalactan protein 30-like n=1 Tax=Typha angustifolia TaxID=59011 RepID=UPI003C306BDB